MSCSATDPPMTCRAICRSPSCPATNLTTCQPPCPRSYPTSCWFELKCRSPKRWAFRRPPQRLVFSCFSSASGILRVIRSLVILNSASWPIGKTAACPSVGLISYSISSVRNRYCGHNFSSEFTCVMPADAHTAPRPVIPLSSSRRRPRGFHLFEHAPIGRLLLGLGPCAQGNQGKCGYHQNK